MKKIQSLILALAMLVSLISAAPVSAEDTGLVLDDGYELFDTAYSSAYGYFAAARNYISNTNVPTKIYNSADGITWKEIKSFSTATAQINEYTRQQLVWWEEPGVLFIELGSSAAWTNNLTSWTTVSGNNGNNRTHGKVEAEGDTMIVSGGKAAKLAKPDTYTGTVNHHIYNANDVYTAAVGMTPADGAGNRTYVEITNGKLAVVHTNDYDTSSANGSFTGVTSFTYTGTNLPYDVKYMEQLGEWALVGGDSTLNTLAPGGKQRKYTVADDTAVTAVETDAKYIIVGKQDGKLYYTDASVELTEDTAWTEVAGSAMTDEVRSITKTGNGTYIAASKSAVFEITDNNGTLTYDVFKEEVEEKLEIGAPFIDGTANAFEGTWLLGGAYSDKLGMYIAYGNTITPEEGDYGRIYTSTDGVKWTLALKSQVTFNKNSTNAAVWWDKAVENEDGTYSGAFVISSATNASGAGNAAKGAWYSTDGLQWHYTTAFELCSDGDIIVHGDYLYTLTDHTIINKVSAIKPDGTAEIEEIAFTPAAAYGATYGRKLAVSDDGNTFIISAGYGNTMSWQVNEQTATDMNDGNAAGSITEVIYDNALGYFVGVTTYESAIYGMWYENPSKPTDLRRLTLRPFGSDGSKMITLTKQGTKYLFGRVDGAVYITDGANLSTSSIFTQAVPERGKTANSIRVRDIIAGAEGKALAIAGGNTAAASDALLVDIESATYKKANDNVSVTANASDILNVGIPYVNTTADSLSVTMITAVYKNNTLLQADMKDVTLSYNEDGLLMQEVTVSNSAPDGCTVKVMLWDADQMPYTTVTTPVFN